MPKRLTSRIIIFLTVVCALFLIGGGYYISEKEDQRLLSKKEHEESIRGHRAREEIRIQFMQKIAEGQSAASWKSIHAALEELPEKTQTDLRLIVDSKLFEARFVKQETLLRAVRRLLEVNTNDLTAKGYLKAAQKIHETNVKSASEISEQSDNCQWNAELNYLRGAVYYRALIFVKKAQKAKARELIQQALESFKKVFECYPKERDAEIAIELLYKQAKAFDGGSGSASQRLQLLPAQEQPGGSDGRDRERGRH